MNIKKRRQGTHSFIYSAAMLIAALTAGNSVLADHHETQTSAPAEQNPSISPVDQAATTNPANQGPTFRPVELWLCNYLKGQNAGGIDKATANWNAWMDKVKDNSYMAVTLTPNYNDPALEFEIAWLGGWPDGAAMGNSEQQLRTEDGSAVRSGFFKVVDCPVHQSFAAVAINPSRPPTPETAVMTFSNCAVVEGKTNADAGAALRAWGDYQKSQGINGPIWAYWPAHGGGDADYDFKLVAGYRDYNEFGAAFDKFGNGGGYRKAAEIMDGVVECDVARLYDMKLRRAMGAPES